MTSANMVSLDTPNAQSVDAMNLDQSASPVINMVNAHVKQDSKEINALNVLLQTTMVYSASLVIVIKSVLSAIDVTKMAIASVRLRLQEENAQYVTASRN